MAFVRKRISPSRRQTPSYQIIETYRECGKVKQRVLANLGCNPTPERALDEFRREMVNIRNLIEGYQTGRAEKLESPNAQRCLDRWRRSYARQREAVQRLESFISSGKDCGSSNGTVTSNQTGSANFLDWVIERNSTGWI